MTEDGIYCILDDVEEFVLNSHVHPHYVHGDPIISGVTQEQPEKRPACGWPITEKLSTGGTTHRPCGSEERVFSVEGQGKYTGRKRVTNICQKHLSDAWKAWNIERADPICPDPRRQSSARFCGND